jgi:hypothetical protein
MMLRVRMMSLLLMSLKFIPLTLRNDDQRFAVQAFYGYAKGAVKRAENCESRCGWLSLFGVWRIPNGKGEDNDSFGRILEDRQ